MTGSIAPNRPGHHGTVVARTVGTVAISCNGHLSTIPGTTPQCVVNTEGNVHFSGTRSLVYPLICCDLLSKGMFCKWGAGGKVSF